ncbi:MAG: hypothetical protein JOY92_09920 [Verrucomicrobia bacterium]|nr:hypothetical protein [Verrucomicrobiota bacterium]
MAPVQVDGRPMSAEELERENRALRRQVQYLEGQRETLSLNRASFFCADPKKQGLKSSSAV